MGFSGTHEPRTLEVLQEAFFFWFGLVGLLSDLPLLLLFFLVLVWGLRFLPVEIAPFAGF